MHYTNQCIFYFTKDGAVAQRVQLWTCDQQIVGSNPTWGKSYVTPWASCSHLCASVTKQYNLVPAKGGWEGSRRPGGNLWQPTAWWITYLWGDCLYTGICVQSSVTNMGNLYLYLQILNLSCPLWRECSNHSTKRLGIRKKITELQLFCFICLSVYVCICDSLYPLECQRFMAELLWNNLMLRSVD